MPIYGLRHSFLCLFYIGFSHFLCLVYTSCHYKSVCIIQLFRRGRSLRSVLILARTRFESKLKPIQGYANRGIEESHLNAIYYREEFALVILVVGYKRPESLVDILVYNFSLAVCFLIIGGRKLKFNTNNSTELILKARHKLRALIRYNCLRRMPKLVDPYNKKYSQATGVYCLMAGNSYRVLFESINNY